MRAHVIIATKGRSEEVAVLIGYLARQSLPPTSTTIVGVDNSDVEGLSDAAAREGLAIKIILSDRPGLPIQRNIGISALRRSGVLASEEEPILVAFFDDDFRPATDWLEKAAAVFAESPDVVGLTGWVLADGVKHAGLSEDEAVPYLTGETPPRPHWASGEEEYAASSAYGCNMAFRAGVFEKCAFDERLPLYAWQEDRDFTQQALRLGRVIYTPRCRGVHLGAHRGRTNGARLGYSQIANPLYLARKGTMTRKTMMRFVMRSIAANHFGTVVRWRAHADYPGRLKGNYAALFDLLRRDCRPEKILEL